MLSYVILHTGISLDGRIDWDGWMSLCAEETPGTHLAYLKDLGIPYIIAGRQQVDLRSEEGVVLLTLHSVEKIRDRYVWLRYIVQKINKTAH